MGRNVGRNVGRKVIHEAKIPRHSKSPKPAKQITPNIDDEVINEDYILFLDILSDEEDPSYDNQDIKRLKGSCCCHN